MKKETLTEKLIKRTYGISGPLDEHKQREADRIGNKIWELYTSLHQLQDIVFPIISKKTTSFRKSSFIVRCSLKRAGI